MSSLIKNIAQQNITFLLLAPNGSGLTGASVTVHVTIDNGAQISGLGSVTELGSGQYNYSPRTAETNGTSVGFLFTATGAVPLNLNFHTDPFVAPIGGSSITGGTFTEKGWRPVPAKHYTREEYRLLKADLAREANERRARDANLSDMQRAKRDAYEALQAWNEAETLVTTSYSRDNFEKANRAKDRYDAAQDRMNELRSIEYIHHLWREHEGKRGRN